MESGVVTKQEAKQVTFFVGQTRGGVRIVASVRKRKIFTNG